MDGFKEFLDNRVFLCALIAWFTAQGTKVIWTLIKEKRFNAERIMGSGGMPSSHSASVVASTFAIGETMGYDSSVFGLAAIFSFIVMYDAANVRMAAGKQAKVINRIIKEIGEHKFHLDRELKELLGHTYLEVVVGMILGIAVGIIFA